MTYQSGQKDELDDKELNAVAGGSPVDTVIGVAKNVWNNILTAPPSSIKGESIDARHKDWTDIE